MSENTAQRTEPKKDRQRETQRLLRAVVVVGSLDGLEAHLSKANRNRERESNSYTAVLLPTAHFTAVIKDVKSTVTVLRYQVDTKIKQDITFYHITISNIHLHACSGKSLDQYHIYLCVCIDIYMHIYCCTYNIQYIK